MQRAHEERSYGVTRSGRIQGKNTIIILNLTLSIFKMQFPYYKQLDGMDCGPSCLRIVAKYYGRSYSLQYLRSGAFITKSVVVNL